MASLWQLAVSVPVAQPQTQNRPPLVRVSGSRVAVAFDERVEIYTYADGAISAVQLASFRPDALAFEGNTLILGIKQSDQVLVYSDAGGTWLQTQSLSDPKPLPQNQGPGGFGAALALVGDTLAVGAPTRDGGSGRVVLFERTASSFAFVTAYDAPFDQLQCFPTPADQHFGRTLALTTASTGAGTALRLAVAKPGIGQAGCTVDDQKVLLLAGRVYTYERSVTGVWASQPSHHFDPTAPEESLQFGNQLWLSADTLVIGPDVGLVTDVLRFQQATWTKTSLAPGGTTAFDGSTVVAIPDPPDGTLDLYALNPQGILKATQSISIAPDFPRSADVMGTLLAVASAKAVYFFVLSPVLDGSKLSNLRMVAQILFGVTNDSSGVVSLHGHIKNVGPGPGDPLGLLPAMSPGARDLLLGFAISQLAGLVDDAPSRAALQSDAARLVRSASHHLEPPSAVTRGRADE